MVVGVVCYVVVVEYEQQVCFGEGIYYVLCQFVEWDLCQIVIWVCEQLYMIDIQDLCCSGEFFLVYFIEVLVGLVECGGFVVGEV